jgi:hypothetical protein
VEPPKPSTRLSTAASKDAESAQKIVNARRSELRTIAGELRRDLDWVVMKCLEKERERRYSTATALGEDLEHFLRDEPVQAGPPSAGYRARKFVTRNRTAVVLAGSGLAVLLAGTGAVAWVSATSHRVREDRADLRALFSQMTSPEGTSEEDLIRAIKLIWRLYGESEESASKVFSAVQWASGVNATHVEWSDSPLTEEAEEQLRRLLTFVPSKSSGLGWETNRELVAAELWSLLAQTDRAQEARLLVEEASVADYVRRFKLWSHNYTPEEILGRWPREALPPGPWDQIE